MATDFIAGTDGDIIIEDGDFVFGHSDDQHIATILTCRPGEIRDTPLMGLGIYGYIESPESASIVARIKRDMRMHLESDGATNIEIAHNGEYKIQATYAD